MSNTELLLEEIEGLPANYMGEILDFVGYLKHKSPPVEQASRKNGAPQKNRSLGMKPPLAQTMEKLWELCKDAPITVDSFLEERHAETEHDEAEYRE